MNKWTKKLTGLVCALALMTLCLATAVAENISFAGGSGTKEDPYQIETLEQLQAMANDMAASYVLTADIDAGSLEAWTPIGTLVAIDEAGETPDPAYAFTGTFDGNGHTISNLNVVGTQMLSGLFGVTANATVSNVTFKNLTVEGSVMVGAIGYTYCSTVENVAVDGATVHGVDAFAEVGYPAQMIGALTGASMDSVYSGCAVSNVTMTVDSNPEAQDLFSGAQNCGILGGGFEGSSLSDCTVSDSTLTVSGDYCYGIGGMNGCVMTGEYYRNCAVSNVTVKTGNHADLIGGAVGYTGNIDGAVTEVSNASTTNVTVSVGDNASRIGGIIGGPFFFEEYAAYYPNPTCYALTNCASDGVVEVGENSTAVGAVAGYAYQLKSENVTTTLSLPLIGEEAE